MKSIVLLKVAADRVNEVHDRLKHLRTVGECRQSFGRYEEAAMIQADSLEDLWQVLACQIRPIPGVVEVFPCFVFDDGSLENPPKHVRLFAGMHSR